MVKVAKSFFDVTLQPSSQVSVTSFRKKNNVYDFCVKKKKETLPLNKKK